jgi:dipeptidyl aminopeptidase/acylaminoacyl peptidase
MNKRIAALATTLILVAVAAISVATVAAAGGFQLESTIAFGSTRDNLTGNPFLAAEVYLINPDGTNPRRLTTNADGDTFPVLSPDGKKIVFDSNRRTAGAVCDGSLNIGDLFLMETDGAEQMFLTRGDSASWSPNGKLVAFHASASYYASGGLETECPTLPFPGAAAWDSDIFVMNVDDFVRGVEQPTNITNSPNKIDDDADWSPDGKQIVFTNRDVTDPDQNNPLSAEIYVLNVDESGMPLVDETGVPLPPKRLTFNAEEERGPAWSPDGTRIAFSCRRGPLLRGLPSFEICVMDADGSNLVQLTSNNVQDLTVTWSPDGQQIVFHQTPLNQMFTMNAALNADGSLPSPTQLTFPPGINLLANWGELRVKLAG